MTSQCYPKFLHYSEADLLDLDPQKIPHHVAIIMDGNRRWVKRQNLSKKASFLSGHWKGASVLSDTVEAASDIGIKTLTVYAFSTENWSRTFLEVETLFRIFEVYLKENRKKMIEQGVRFGVIGDITPFPESLKNEITKTLEMTKHGEVIDLVVAMNYGGRDDVRRAMVHIADEIKAGDIEPDDVTEELISSHLDTARWRDPDLLIRTSGEMRVSNFLLWQFAYSEVYVTETLWPEFTPHDLLESVQEYQTRIRRRGQ